MKKKLNLYPHYRNHNKKRTSVSFGAGALMYVLALLLIVMSLYVSDSLNVKYLEREKEKHLAFIQDPLNQSNYTELLSDKAQLASQEEYQGKIAEVSDVLGQKSKFTSRIIKNIQDAKPAGVTVDSIDFTKGSVLVRYTSQTVVGPSLFAQRLGFSASFVDVEYLGFSKSQTVLDDEAMTVSETFVGDITLTLAGGY